MLVRLFQVAGKDYSARAAIWRRSGCRSCQAALLVRGRKPRRPTLRYECETRCATALRVSRPTLKKHSIAVECRARNSRERFARAPRTGCGPSMQPRGFTREDD